MFNRSEGFFNFTKYIFYVLEVEMTEFLDIPADIILIIVSKQHLDIRSTNNFREVCLQNNHLYYNVFNQSESIPPLNIFEQMMAQNGLNFPDCFKRRIPMYKIAQLSKIKNFKNHPQ